MFVSFNRGCRGHDQVYGFPSINKTDHHEITEILLIVLLNTISLRQHNSNTTGFTCGEGTDDPSRAHEFTLGFYWDLCSLCDVL